MTWDGPWDAQAWDGPWDDPAPAAPVVAAPAVSATLLLVVAAQAVLDHNGGLRGQLEITHRLSAVMTRIIPIPRGDDVSYTLTVLDADGAPTNITGDDLELEVKAAVGGPDPALIAKTVGAGITLLAQAGATLGQATVSFSGSDTDLPAGTYWLDVVHIRDGVRTHVIQPTGFPIANVVNRR